MQNINKNHECHRVHNQKLIIERDIYEHIWVAYIDHIIKGENGKTNINDIQN